MINLKIFSVLRSASALISKILIFCIWSVRPLLGSYGACRYAYSCYDFGIDTVQKEPLPRALYVISKRVLSCNPFTRIKES